MKKTIVMLSALALLILASLNAMAIGVGISIGTGLNWTYSNSPPGIWIDPNTRIFDAKGLISTRDNNYCFTGEYIEWDVLVRDANGKEDVSEVGVWLEDDFQEKLEANCYSTGNVHEGVTYTSGNPISWAHTGTGAVTYDTATDEFYTCRYTCEPAEHGEYWVHAMAEDTGHSTTQVDEDEFWFINPTLALGLSGPINFGSLTPGQTGYSKTLYLKNNAESGSGVILRMFISGTDFYDPGSGISARCPTSNVLSLSNIRYYSTVGSWSTGNNPVSYNCDAEKYCPIPYETGNLASRRQIISGHSDINQGAEMSLTFKLALPSPCMGSFTDGDIFFWGEVV